VLLNEGRVRAGGDRACTDSDGDANARVTYAAWVCGDRELVAVRFWQIADWINIGARVEGVDWCYGWGGPAVDALRAAVVTA
jgi:hypothetical protein